MAWFEACWVELEFGVLRDGVEVVEVEAVIGGVLCSFVVDGHSAEPADCMLCFALVEECGFVFFELACGFACPSDHESSTFRHVAFIRLAKL